MEEFVMLLSEMIKLQAHTLERHGSAKTVFSIVANYGKTFIPEIRPEWLDLQEPKQCFKNSLNLSLITGLTYCEGFIYRVMPIHHAWCIDDEGKVYDPTIKDQHNIPYFGIPFEQDFAFRVAQESGMYGILDNYEFRKIYDLPPEEFMHPEWINK